MSHQQNTVDEVIHSLGLEALELENVFAQAKLDYHNTPTLLGKKWYSVGLESIDSDKEKDSANKKGIIRRMIDAIVKFIKNVIEKFKSFFGSENKNKIKEDEDFLKKYNGPSDEAMAEVIRTCARMAEEAEKDNAVMARQTEQMKKDIERNREHTNKTISDFDKRMKESRESIQALRDKIGLKKNQQSNINDALGKALTELQGTSDKPLTAEKVEEIVEDGFVAKINRKLTNHRLWMLLAMMEPGYREKFKEVMDAVDKIVHDGTQLTALEGSLQKAQGIKELLADMYKEHNEASTIPAKESDEKISKLVMSGSDYTAHADLYLTRTLVTITAAASYLNNLVKVIASLNEAHNDNEAVQQIGQAQKISSIITEAMTLAHRVVDINQKVAEVLR